MVIPRLQSIICQLFLHSIIWVIVLFFLKSYCMHQSVIESAMNNLSKSNNMTVSYRQQNIWYGPNLNISASNRQVTRAHKHIFKFFMYEDLQPFMPSNCSGYNMDSPDKIFIEQLQNHPQRTFVPEKASIFVIPLLFLQTFECNRNKYRQWLTHSIKNLQVSFWFRRYHGHDHLIPAFHWKFNEFGDIHLLLPSTYRHVLKNVTMTRYESYNDERVQFLQPSSLFKKHHQKYDKNKSIIIVPYFINSKIPNVRESFTTWKKRKFTVWYHTRSAPSAHGATALRHRPWTEKASSQKCMSCSIHRGYTDSKQWLRGWQNSKFCLVIRGDTPTSHAFYRAIKSSCIPVLISTGFEAVGMPFSSFVDLSSFVVKISEDEWLKGGLADLEQKLNVIASNSTLMESKLQALHDVQPIMIWNHPHSITTTSVLRVVYSKM